MTTQSELILPTPKTPLAQSIVNVMDRMEPVIHPVLSRQQFATTLVATVNQLDASKVSDAHSLLIAAFNCAAIGLLPGGQLGLAYLIPRKGRVNLELGYRGLLELAFRNKHLRSVHAECVFTEEPFEWRVTQDGPQLEHRPDPDRDPTRARELTRLAYCIYHTTQGGHGVRIVTRKQLDKIDSRKHVWASDYYEMARKSAIRRAAKDWQMTIDMMQAMHLDEMAEVGEHQQALPKAAEALETLEVKASYSLEDLPDVEEAGENE